MRRSELKKEIHMIAAFQRFVRLSPFRDHGSFWKFFIQESAEILPQLNGAFAVFIILYQRTCHIYTEAVAAHAQPKSHDILHSLSGRHSFRRIHGFLPALCYFIKTIV